MKDFRLVSVIIPSLDPDEKLNKTVNGLRELGFCDFILVNDGSKAENEKYFPNASDCVVLKHEKNFGKGRALKTAFAYFLENRKDMLGVVTVDGDGQHIPTDVLTCVNTMLENENGIVLGARDFSHSGIPARSQFGNSVTSFIFRTLCGIKITDTQTGLRAFPKKYIKAMTEIDGDRFEYETNMLLEMKTQKIPYSEIKISTVYIEDNQTSHFKPLRDSFRIYKLIIKFILSSSFSAVLDIIIFSILSALFTRYLGNFSILVCTAVARAVSSLTNYFINKETVFKNNGSIHKTILRYYILCIPVMLVSAGVVYFGAYVFGDGTIMKTVIKLIVDTILYFLNFRIQRDWVFKRDGDKNAK